MLAHAHIHKHQTPHMYIYIQSLTSRFAHLLNEKYQFHGDLFVRCAPMSDCRVRKTDRPTDRSSDWSTFPVRAPIYTHRVVCEINVCRYEWACVSWSYTYMANNIVTTKAPMNDGPWCRCVMWIRFSCSSRQSLDKILIRTENVHWSMMTYEITALLIAGLVANCGLLKRCITEWNRRVSVMLATRHICGQGIPNTITYPGNIEHNSCTRYARYANA